jgi:hypothetical protein
MNAANPKESSRTQKIIHELREFLAIFLYMAIFFSVLRTYTHLVLLEYQISYAAYGLTFLKAMMLAKIILMGETFRLGARFHDKPLIIPTLYSTLMFSLLALTFEVIEHVILDAFHGKTPGGAFAEILGEGWPRLVGMTLVIFVSFLPFFAFRALERVLGEGKLSGLFFKPRSLGAQSPEVVLAPHKQNPI